MSVGVAALVTVVFLLLLFGLACALGEFFYRREMRRYRRVMRHGR